MVEIVDRNKFTAGLEALIHQVVEHDAAQLIFRRIRLAQRAAHEIVTLGLGFGGPADQLQFIGSLDGARLMHGLATVD
jgi:hypothetical protein